MTGYALLDLLLLALPAAALAFWWSGARARELAVEHARAACRRREVQFLDQSVALARRRPVRVRGGAIGMRRDFAFEYTGHGAFRDGGTVTMQGRHLVEIRFPWTRDADGHRVYEHAGTDRGRDMG